MAVLLSLEASTGVCSAALHEDGRLLASSELHVTHSASAQLTVMINNLLAMCGLKASSLAGVVVSEGPGSYTGLRIGVATAKGLCFALNIPLIAVNTLELLAFQVIHSPLAGSVLAENMVLCPLLDARRMEVYCLVANRELELLEPTAARVIDARSFEDILAVRKVLFFGNGSDKCREVIRHANAFFAAGIIPVASVLGVIGYERFIDGKWEALSSFEPFYLKDFLIKKPKTAV